MNLNLMIVWYILSRFIITWMFFKSTHNIPKFIRFNKKILWAFVNFSDTVSVPISFPLVAFEAVLLWSSLGVIVLLQAGSLSSVSNINYDILILIERKFYILIKK